ncbi:hypothetical protein P5W99_03770 [Paraburkholderia sp. A3BS-1L]
MDFWQRASRGIEILAILHERSAFELAGELIAPRVICARVNPGIATAERNQIAAMPAHVREHMNFTLRVALNQQRFSDYFGRVVVTRIRNFAGVADANPGASKDALSFEFSEVSGGIERPWHAVRRTAAGPRQCRQPVQQRPVAWRKDIGRYSCLRVQHY